MNRALRRYQQRVARVRTMRMLWCYFRRYHEWENPWRARNHLGAYFMRDPNWHTHQFDIEPARAQAQRLLKQVLSGEDPDSLNWPDYHKPHRYYW